LCAPAPKKRQSIATSVRLAGLWETLYRFLLGDFFLGGVGFALLLCSLICGQECASSIKFRSDERGDAPTNVWHKIQNESMIPGFKVFGVRRKLKSGDIVPTDY